MSKFDPNRLLERELGSCGYAFYLRGDIETIRAEHRLGGVGSSLVSTAIRCLLVGLDSPASRALNKAALCLEEAIRTNERPRRHYFPEATEAMRCEDMVLCRWLSDAVADRTYLELFLGHVKAYFAPLAKKPHYSAMAFMPMCLIAGDCRYALDLMAATPKLKPPKSPAGVRTEAQMAYLLARVRLGLGEYSGAEIRTATDRFLSRSVATWLADGQYTRVATWMMLAHWGGAGGRVPPKDALLRCYEYLDCDPPQHPAAWVRQVSD